MSYVILKSIDDENHYCFACNTTDIAFGPLMYFRKEGDRGTIEEFLEFLGCDPRTLEKRELEDRYDEYLKKMWGES